MKRVKLVWAKLVLAYFGCGLACATALNVSLYRNGAPTLLSVVDVDRDAAMMIWATVIAPILFWPAYAVSFVIALARLVVARAAGS